MEIKKIVIAGAGTMGYSMAQIFAKYNYDVTIYDLKAEAIENAKKRIEENTQILIQDQELTSEQEKLLHQHLKYTTDKECFKNCNLVVESIIEKVEIKQSFYQEISRLVREDTILATNTSGISINTLASAVYKPERFIGMHWFNPSHLILLIEIIKGDKTLDTVAQAIKELSIHIGKKPVIVQKDVLGFAANRIQFAVLREALYLVEQGVISKEDIDAVMKYGLGFRYACLGPLEVADFGGLDTFYHISDYLMKDLCNDTKVPSELAKLYEEGHLGIKSQQGFYDYHDGKDHQAIKNRDEHLLKIYNALYK